MLLQCEAVQTTMTMRLTERKHVKTFPLTYGDVDLEISLIHPSRSTAQTHLHM